MKKRWLSGLLAAGIFMATVFAGIQQHAVMAEAEGIISWTEPVDEIDGDEDDADVDQDTEADTEQISPKETFTGLKKKNGNLYYYVKDIPQTGWKKIDGGIYYFQPNKHGAAARGLTNIDGERYFFTTKHLLKTGWKTVDGKKYYFKTSGSLGIKGRALTGIHKISKKWFVFGKSGVLKTKTFSQEGTTYYIQNKLLEAYKTGDTYYRPNGKEMTSVQAEDYRTLRRARKVVLQVTNSSMSKSEKLLECFQWTIHHPYIVYRKFQPTADWPSTYANDHFVRKGGDCHADGAAFAYLARALGYKDVYVCLDCDGKRAQGHCWTEINGLAYDPLFAEARSFSANYGVSYNNYRLRPVLKLRVAEGY